MYDAPSLVLLLLLHAFCVVVGFVLLTEPCLNPNFQPSLWDKVNYLSLLGTHGAIPVHEWSQRFQRACLTSLFATAVIQAWFVARLNGYIHRASIQHTHILALQQQPRSQTQNKQKQKGKVEKQEVKVPSFVRQLEGVSLTFLGLPFVWIAMLLLVVLFGAPLMGNWKPTAILAAHLCLLVAFPLIHILGLPSLSFIDFITTSSDASTKHTASTLSTATSSSTSSSVSTIVVPDATNLWTSLLSLRPNPTFLLPLYYPLIFASLGTVVAAAVLALDWNTSYQTYPFPLFVGSLAGVALGDLYTVWLVIFG